MALKTAGRELTKWEALGMRLASLFIVTNVVKLRAWHMDSLVGQRPGRKRI
jgi:hypothetical protein